MPYRGKNRKWWTLAAVAFGLFMIMFDNTVVNVSLPAMQRSLGLQISELQWIVTGYALTFGAGLFALTYGLIEANNFGWGSPRIVGAFAAAGVLLAAFVALERHQRVPMLDLSLFRNHTFAGANTVMLLSALAMFGVFFYVSLYMQQVLGYSPVQAGAAFLPMTVLIITIAPRAGHLADRVGSRLLAGGGQLLVAVALVLFARLTVDSSYWALLVPMIVSGAGMAMTMTPATAAAMSSVRPDKAGVGSAVLNSARQVGGSIGIAVTGAVVASRLTAALALGAPRPVAFVRGMHGGFLLSAAIALTGSGIAFATLRAHVGPAVPSTPVGAPIPLE